MATGDKTYFNLYPQTGCVYFPQQSGPLEVTSGNDNTALHCMGDILMQDQSVIGSDKATTFVKFNTNDSNTFSDTSVSFTSVEIQSGMTTLNGGILLKNVGNSITNPDPGTGIPFYAHLPDTGVLPSGTVYMVGLSDTAGKPINVLCVAP
jgi:hypothetical protein